MQEDFEAGQDTTTVPFLEESTIDGPELDGTKDLRDETVQGAEQTTGGVLSVKFQAVRAFIEYCLSC